jgi:hypothetical protein
MITMKELREDRRILGRDLKARPIEKEAGMLDNQSERSMTYRL